MRYGVFGLNGLHFYSQFGTHFYNIQLSRRTFVVIFIILKPQLPNMLFMYLTLYFIFQGLAKVWITHVNLQNF